MQVQVSLSLEICASASVQQIEEQIIEAGRASMRQALIESLRAWEQQHRCCPKCARYNLRVEGSIRRRLSTLFGRVELSLRRFRCQACSHRWCPAHQLLAPLAHKQMTAPLQEAAVLAGASWPYRHAAQFLERLCGAHISAEEIRLVTNAQGQHRAAAHQQAADVQQETLVSPSSPSSQGATPTPDTVVALDGGWVGSREQRGGMEGKVAVVATCKEYGEPQPHPDPTQMTWYELAKAASQGKRVGPVHPRARYRHRTYCATFASSKQLGRQAAYAAHEMGMVPTVVVADGATWIKTEAREHFPHATHILDWAHLWRVVRKAIGETALLQQQSQAWKKMQGHQLSQWLWRGQVSEAQACLQSWQSQGKALRQACAYLEHQREWIGDYEQWKREGYPIGSGIIERGVAVVINRRMKRRGMRWKRSNATAVVAVRVDLLNTDWQRPSSQRAFP